MKNSYAFNRPSQSLHFLPHFLCFLLTLSYVQFANAQCPMGQINLTTQAQVDNFTTDYPGCTHVLNNLVIGPSMDIVNLNGLSGVAQIDGALLIIDNSTLTDVSGLNGLTSVGTEINIQNNPVLGSIDLSGVSAPNVTRFMILNNAMLTIALLPTDVITISERLQYYNNPLLTTISEMNSLTSVGDVLSISNVLANTLPAFNSLTEIGTNVPSVTSGLYLDTNPNITAIPTFPMLNSIGGLISIQINQSLTGFDLSAVSTHDMRVMVVRDNPVLTSALLPTDVTTISDRLQYYNNPLLATISEMNSLTSVGDVLSISNVLANTLPAFSSLTQIGTNVPSVTSGLYLDTNPNITAIPTFPVLNSIGGLISIQINQNLISFDLSAVSTHDIRSMFVHNNPALTSALLPTDVTAISERLSYQENPLLESVSAMNNLASVGQYLTFNRTNACYLPDFPNLSSIGIGMVYGFNPKLKVIPKLNNGAIISDLISIVDNPALSYCAIEAVCNFLQGAGTRNISGNAGACLNEAALTASCLANDPYPVPALDPASITNVQLGQQALLILANLPPGTAAVWYAEDQVTELYNDEANHFQPVINQVTTFHGAMLDIATGCISSFLTVTICPDNLPLSINCPIGLPALTANSSCQATLGDYTALATLSGGCDIPLNPIVQSPAPGTIVNPGTVAITLTASNTAGQSATCVFNVNISGGCGGN